MTRVHRLSETPVLEGAMRSSAEGALVMAHGRDKPKKEARRPKKAKPPKHPAATRAQQTIATVSGQDHHRWSTEERTDSE